mmetsp:Transcript_13703/g.20519  ORF Transcript_13703/g.20519 Transcript_13703/m.20519 type:complete len:99 (-) Transcript_13703:136-432(-)|eukprot:CAMPEP_0185018262 /NCGR_PEP_ID=MMETSP1103-20130426/1043_1 /TAXON_ID=36769 /ORGANISM="Paraphysomonas bandaiensis, Strain Caron Lab Isolate" /LENGTH=98 /DNA_ID=CAMNT_0027548009 /DNA_START=46 /DNA_END=342 /DNA_ORIENTATION=+
MEDTFMNSARSSARKTGRDKADDAKASGRVPETGRSVPMSGRSEIMESSRDTMSTARVTTALAALAAERHQLEGRLAMIDAALEQENRKAVTRPRGKK